MACRRDPVAFEKILNHFISPSTLHGLIRAGLCLVVVGVCLEGCERTEPRPAPVTITLLDPGWLDKEFVAWRNHEEEQFTRETGILVKDLPAPETAVDQLELLRKLLRRGSDAPDVFAIDVIWPRITAQYSLDLTPYLADAAQDFPGLVANNTVDGKLVAMPYHVDAGLLFYRSDLLHEYGYRGPPTTWDALEAMAAHIQEGEHAKGKKEFWGFVWEGAPSEALTCNALEWQASEGGGRIIEDDNRISVNNPQTVLSWERAAKWVGSISPVSVTAYREWDALNVWRSGNAAFMRNWPTSVLTSEGEGSAVRGRFAATLLPGGKGGRTGTLGGASLSVFRGTRHPKEAVALVRFLVRRDVELQRTLATSQPPVIPALYDLPEVTRERPSVAEMKSLLLSGVVRRPSSIAGAQYEQVSEAYFTAVHSVLTKRTSAREAASDLGKELSRLTGFHSGPPVEREHERSPVELRGSLAR